MVHWWVYAVLEDRLIEGSGFPHPSPRSRRLIEGALRLRARLPRWLPPRRHPRLRTEMVHRRYPRGYRIEELGPAAPPPQAGPVATD